MRRRLVDDGIEISHRLQLASRQILGHDWRPYDVVPPDQPALKTALKELQEIWQTSLALTRKMGEYQTAHSLLDKLASLPEHSVESIHGVRREVDQLDRKRERRRAVIHVLVPSVVLLGALTVVSAYLYLTAKLSNQKLEIDKQALQIRTDSAESEKKLADAQVNSQQKLLALNEGSLKSQQFELLGQRASEYHAQNVTARLMAEAATHRDVIRSKILLSDALASALLPLYAARVFDDQVSEECLEGEGPFGQRFRIAVTSDALSRSNSMLAAAGTSKTARLRAWNLDTMRPIAHFSETKWEIPLVPCPV